MLNVLKFKLCQPLSETVQGPLSAWQEWFCYF